MKADGLVLLEKGRLVMKPMFRLACCGILLSLAACGGNNEISLAAKSPARTVAASAVQAAPLPEVNLPGYRSQYLVAASGSEFLVTDITTSQTTSYSASQRLRMADGAVAFDLSGSAGQSFRLYQAAFDRKPDAWGLGFYINVLDAGVHPDAISQSFIDSQEFASKYGSLSNAAFLTVLYNNVLHRAPDQAGFDANLSYLDGTNPSGAVVTRAQMLRFFSESTENVALTEPSVRNGIDYLPWGMSLPSQPVNTYVGTYNGNFAGTEAGPISLTSTSNGSVTLTAHNHATNAEMSGTGSFAVGGKFTAQLTGGGRTMNLVGSVDAASGYVTGTWSFANVTGSGVVVALKATPPAGPQFAQVRAIISQRCVGCHSATPTLPGYPSAPLGIRFDTEMEIRNRADQIYAVSVQSQFMPYLNQTGMTQAERDYIGSWVLAGKP
jgi:mono/diheme cytochrome c family protein